jgi:hypothetical protein
MGCGDKDDGCIGDAACPALVVKTNGGTWRRNEYVFSGMPLINGGQARSLSGTVSARQSDGARGVCTFQGVRRDFSGSFGTMSLGGHGGTVTGDCGVGTRTFLADEHDSFSLVANFAWVNPWFSPSGTVPMSVANWYPARSVIDSSSRSSRFYSAGYMGWRSRSWQSTTWSLGGTSVQLH